MAHNRKLVIGGASLTVARLNWKNTAQALDAVRDDLECEMIESGYLDEAPFKWVGMILRYGLIDEAEPHYERVNTKHGDLPVAIELNTHRLQGAPVEEITKIFRKAALTTLVHAGKKYGLKIDRLESLLQEVPQ